MAALAQGHRNERDPAASRFTCGCTNLGLTLSRRLRPTVAQLRTRLQSCKRLHKHRLLPRNPHSVVQFRACPAPRAFLLRRLSDAGRRCMLRGSASAGIRNPSRKQMCENFEHMRAAPSGPDAPRLIKAKSSIGMLAIFVRLRSLQDALASLRRSGARVPRRTLCTPLKIVGKAVAACSASGRISALTGPCFGK